jgi:hypothetical protein
MKNQSFNPQHAEAIKQMKELQKRSIYKESEPKAAPTQKPRNSLLGGFNIPFLDSLKTDTDLTLILGILLLLLSEKADRRLLFALVYILL